MANSLSPKQQMILTFLKSEIRKKGYPPTVREICEAVGLSSTSTVHAHLETLEKKGYIRRSPTKNRSTEILEDDFYNFDRELISVPIVGEVTAGVPILAEENIESTFPIPAEYVHQDPVFMLRVRGDSMIGAGIFSKDLVLVRQQATAQDGDIVVALLDDSATVKYYFREQNYIRLEPANQKYSAILSKEVVILGKVVGLFRMFENQK